MSGNTSVKRKREDQFALTASDATEGKRSCPAASESAHTDPIDLSPLGARRNTMSPTSSASPASASVPAQETIRMKPPTTNKILLEALAKIVELQNELDAFEHDLDESEEEEQRLDAEVARSFATHQEKCAEAEALGFAMCARETLLFLQGEGVPSDSLLYKSLLDKLVGRADDQLRT